MQASPYFLARRCWPFIRSSLPSVRSIVCKLTNAESGSRHRVSKIKGGPRAPFASVESPRVRFQSIRAVFTNPAAIAAWGLIVAGGLVVGSVPFFVGLIVVMPVLGHATWHLYRRIVPTDSHARASGALQNGGLTTRL
jgi:hypothetical protein